MIFKIKHGESFSGQHFVSLPDEVLRSHAKHPLMEELRVTDAGFFPKARGHCVDRLLGTPTTLAILCVNGNGWASWNQGQPRIIRRGDLVWFPASRTHAYGSEDTAPWTIFWMHLAGTQTDVWRKQLLFPPEGGVRSLNTNNMAAVSRAMEEIYGILETGITASHGIAAASWARIALCQAMSIHSASLQADSATERVTATMDWMKAHLGRRVRLFELAALAGMSVPHYSMLFRRTTGYAPVDYLIRLRIQHAARLLDATGMSITDVASAAGFEDAYYFSRMFRKLMALSPSQYRQRPKG